MERHLIGCEACRQELIEVAHLPGLMHRLTLDDVAPRASARDVQAEPRPDLVPEIDAARPLSEATTASVWSAVVHRLSRSRTLLLAMIMVLVLATGGLASAELLTHQPAPGL